MSGASRGVFFAGIKRRHGSPPMMMLYLRLYQLNQSSYHQSSGYRVVLLLGKLRPQYSYPHTKVPNTPNVILKLKGSSAKQRFFFGGGSLPGSPWIWMLRLNSKMNPILISEVFDPNHGLHRPCHCSPPSKCSRGEWVTSVSKPPRFFQVNFEKWFLP